MVALKIVVVDDDKDTREWMRDVLTFAGHTVVTWPALTGAHALICDEQPDLAILDLQMLGNLQAGMLVFDELQCDPQTAHIPPILYSADHRALQRYAPALRGCGGDVLGKPFKLEDLATMIARLTDHSR